MTHAIIPVILCGGSGTRLWPESRGARAKQFLPLVAGIPSLFAATVARVPADAGFAPPVILCGADHVALAQPQLGGRAAEFLIEPAARNTGPAIGLAVARAVATHGPDTLLLVLPSDQMIADPAAFSAAVAAGAELASDDWLVTFGITPDRPETGFGYIASGAALSERGFAASRFIEKPPFADAEAMVAAGGFSWNAGIFLFRAGAMQAAMQAHCPAIWAAAAAAVAQGQADLVDGAMVFSADAASFAAAPAISIDYAVMEHAGRVAVVPATMGWSDLGSWLAVHGHGAPDADGNVVAGDVFSHANRDCLLRAGSKRLSVIGMAGVAVIVDGDDILVMPLDRAQDVRAAAAARGK